MAENSDSGSPSGLYFIVGGLVVAVAVGGFAYSNGYLGGKTTTEKTTISSPFGGTSSTTITTTTDKK